MEMNTRRHVCAYVFAFWRSKNRDLHCNHMTDIPAYGKFTLTQTEYGPNLTISRWTEYVCVCMNVCTCIAFVKDDLACIEGKPWAINCEKLAFAIICSSWTRSQKCVKTLEALSSRRCMRCTQSTLLTREGGGFLFRRGGKVFYV